MPIFTAIGAAIAGALFGGSAIAAAVIAGGLALGARLAFSYLNRPKPQSQTAIRSQVRAGAGIDCATLYGEDKVLGQLLYYAKWGSGNSRNAYVYKLADGWCDSLAPYVFIFGQRLALTEVAAVGNEAARYTVEGYGSALVIRFYDGRPGQLADSELVSATAHLDTPWRSTSRGTNICYVVVDQTYDAGAYQQGLPTITFVLRGLREYDPRLDSTVAGGDGPQRLNDRSTWAFTQNNAVHRLNYLLGQKGVLSGEVMIGPGKTIGQIEVAMHMVAANVCDTERTVSGDTVPTYHCNQWVSSGDDQLAILKNIEDAMAGYAVNASGLDGVLAGAPQIPVREITAADIRADGQITTSNRSPVGQGFNALSGDYSCPETGFEPEGLKTVTVNADVVKDGGKRAERNDFPQVSNNHIAQYLLNIRYRQNRKAKRRALPVSRELGFDTAIGEWVTYEGLTWLVTNRDFDKTLRVYLRLAETGADVYDEEGIGAGPVVVPSPAPVNPSLISTVANFQAAAGVIAGENGAQRPALEFTWDDPEDPTVTGLSIVYRKAGTIAPEYTAFTDFASSGKLIVDNGVAGDTSYEARATIRTTPDRFKTYTPWVTTVVETSPLRVILREIGADVYGTLTDLRAELDDIAATLTDLATSAAQGQLSLRENVQDTFAAVGDSVALVRQQTKALATADQALAQAVSTVTAALGGNTANVLVKYEAEADPDGVEARIAQFLRASVGGDYLEAVEYLEIYDDEGALKSRKGFLVDSLFFTTKVGGTVIVPFYVDANQVYMQNIRVDWADIVNVSIGSAQIGDLTVGTSNLDYNAVVSTISISADNINVSQGQYASWTEIARDTIENQDGPTQSLVLEDWALSAYAIKKQGYGIVRMQIRLRRLEDDAVLHEINAPVSGTGSGILDVKDSAFQLSNDTYPGLSTIVVEIRLENGGGFEQMVFGWKYLALTWKR